RQVGSPFPVAPCGGGPATLWLRGGVAERPNAVALKATVGKPTGGSNPSASARRDGSSWPRLDPFHPTSSRSEPAVVRRCTGEGRRAPGVLRRPRDQRRRRCVVAGGVSGAYPWIVTV